MTRSVPIPQRGQIVRARQRLYLVEEVTPDPAPDHCTLVRLACLDDDAQGQPLEVLWEIELDAEIRNEASWDAIASRGFDPPHRFAAYLHTLRWNCVTATNPRLFQAPFRAGIQLHAYQIEPLRKALLLPRVNLFIADDVGLGKTIEAGLIARELLLRKKVRDIVVSCPPGVVLQWQDELEARFGLTFEVLDREFVQRVRRQRGYGVNPWTTHSRFLISHRLLIDEAYAGPLRDWLGTFRAGSLLILDEAHHAAPSSGYRYAVDSRITRAVRDLAPKFEHRLFLSATPHNGHSNSFSALLEILDPQRFCRGVSVRGKKDLDAVMVRRLKEDIREAGLGVFPRREVEQIDIDGLPSDTPELILSEMLDEYRRIREARLADRSRQEQAVGKLLHCGLQQRLLSSVAAFLRTLRVHRRTAEQQWAGSPAPATGIRQRDLPLLRGGVGADDDQAGLDEEQLAAEEDAQFAAATRGSIPPVAVGIEAERHLLDKMEQIGRVATGQPDARVRRLVDWIRANMCPGLPGFGTSFDGPPARWNERRLLIFTEYEDTLRYLDQQLSGLVRATDQGDERIEIYRGSTPTARREEIKTAFNGDPARHPVRILLATDAAREGINLQTRCHDLFHFDVPWNPARLEQRNGRIDRKLQPAPVVTCRYFVYRQRKEDRVLRALVRKTDLIKRELGSLAQVVEGRLSVLLEGGIRHPDIDRLAVDIEGAGLDPTFSRVVGEELEEARERQADLLRQTDHLKSDLETSRDWVGLDLGHLCEALSCALELAGVRPLTKDAQGGFTIPDLAERLGGDVAWTDTLDTLRTPRRKGQTEWEWRREATIRPVVFTAPETMTDEVVQLHLEHRLVQRLLSRFLAQGFVHHDLSRACLTQTADPITRVVLIGRLCLYGPGASRLHEELIHVTARWVDPRIRTEPLRPYAREAERKTLDLLEEATRKPSASSAIPADVVRKFQSSATRDLHELLSHLNQRGEGCGKEAEEGLTARADKEAKAMQALLEDQKQRIEATIESDRRAHAQGYITGLLPEEERQLEANRRHWAARLEALASEVEDEPRRVREVYAVKARRVEPVGLVYLWAVTG